MKGYKRLIILIPILLGIYIIAEVNRPEKVKWDATLSSKDKNPYGAFILYQQLKDIFPVATINTYHLPVYNQLNDFSYSNTAYLLIEPATLILTHEDIDQLLSYAATGNYVFISSGNIADELMDSLKLSTKSRFEFMKKGASSINLKNPALRASKNYSYERMTLDKYFNSYDTAATVVLGDNQFNDANYVKMAYGEGAFFIHPMPLCFSNDFLLTLSNAEYAAKALSYLPRDVHTLFWDEYYKQPGDSADTPLRYILGNKWLLFAFRIGLVTIILFVFFEMKRRQKIIPIIPPLRNTTLDFVKTVGNVYFNNRDNKNIALKKISYFLESVRSSYNVSTSVLNEEFIAALAKKTSLPETEIRELVGVIEETQHITNVSDLQLIRLNQEIDRFNKKN